MSEKDVSFLKIWTGGGRDLRPEIKEFDSYQLFALYDISRDLSKGGYLEGTRNRRHLLTHRYLIPHVIPDSQRADIDGPEYHVGYRQLFEDCIDLLKLVRSAVIYLVAFVNRRERPSESGMLLRMEVPSHRPGGMPPSRSPV